MISDTLRQKFIYSTPFSDEGLPLVVLDDEALFVEDRTSFISGKDLYFWEEERFLEFIELQKEKCDSIVLLDDYHFKSGNSVLLKGAKCHLLSFAYHFKKAGFLCAVRPSCV